MGSIEEGGDPYLGQDRDTRVILIRGVKEGGWTCILVVRRYIKINILANLQESC